MASGLKIVSDFKDYYDYLSNDKDPLMIYERRYESSMSRGAAIKHIKELGIPVIELGMPRQFKLLHDKVVIYTDVKAHESKGKRIVDIDPAVDMYSTNLCSPLYTDGNGVTVKFLQIGELRYRITFQNKNFNTEISEGEIVDIVRLESGLNYSIQEPIFSLDYIQSGNNMLCMDFNQVQKLESLSFQNILASEVIVEQIVKAKLAYNKI